MDIITVQAMSKKLILKSQCFISPMKINNRRYLGNKYKLVSFIKEIVNTECHNVKTFFDVFAGTGSVASAFMDKNLILNDLLYSNHLAHMAWFSSEPYNQTIVSESITTYNNLDSNKIANNYMSQNFSNTYFSKDMCLKIGFIRDDIENRFKSGLLNNRERAILITSLIYAMDKNAATCGHYDAWRKNATYSDELHLEMPEISPKISQYNQCYNMDSNILARKVKCDIAYLDPPYNSRQYSDAYHLLENVATWTKPEVYGVAKKMDRSHIKSEYCTKNALQAFKDLVLHLDCKYILLSYNNTGDTANDRSNAKLKDDDIIKILSLRGEVKVFSKSYKAFTTGKSDNKLNAERLFLCKVNNIINISPLNYTGGKAKLLPQIKPLFPSHIDTFVDLFCGGCNVGINVNADRYIYNDVSPELIGLYQCLQKTSADQFFLNLQTHITKYGLSDSSTYSYSKYGCNSNKGLGLYNKTKFIALRDSFNKLTNHNQFYYELLFLLIVYGFNNQIRFNSNGKFNLPVGKRDFNQSIQKKLRTFIDIIQNQNAIFSCDSFENLDISSLTPASLVYCDPPYLITTATYNENGGWTETDEIKLLQYLDMLDKHGIRFALSNVLTHKGRNNCILASWLNERHYKINHLDKNYSNSSYHASNTKQETVEVLITNY